MKILQADWDQGVVKLRPDTVDDLWHLAHVVEEGDLATALTQRTPEEASKGKERAQKLEKKPMVLGVRVQQVEFHEFSNRLRLLGVIEEGPQELGSHHTLNVEVRTELTIKKPGGWSRRMRERLDEAVEETQKPIVTFLSMEENEAVVALLRAFGVQKVADVQGHVSGKRFQTESKGVEAEFFDEIRLALREKRAEDSPLLVVGPGFAKERFFAYVKEKEPALARGAVVEGTGQAGMAGVQEALRRGMVDRVAKEQRVSVETRAVEAFLTAIATDGPATYGYGQVKEATERGAVEALLITDKLLRERGDELLELAKGTGAEALVISTLHEAGHKLEALGGVGARLRYRLQG